MNYDNIKVPGHIGRWHVIDTKRDSKNNMLYLLEHDDFGDTAPSIIVDEKCNIILEDVWNGWDDLHELLESEGSTF